MGFPVSLDFELGTLTIHKTYVIDGGNWSEPSHVNDNSFLYNVIGG